MQCPYCQADNLEKMAECYNCGKDLSMLRLVVNKARHHYNLGLEHAERQRYGEAVVELRNCLELDRRFVSAYIVLGTVYAKTEDYEQARSVWEQAIALEPSILKAHQYLSKVDAAREAGPLLRPLKRALAVLIALCVIAGVSALFFLWPDAQHRRFKQLLHELPQADAARRVEMVGELETIRSTFRRPGLTELAQRLALSLRREEEHGRFLEVLRELRDSAGAPRAKLLAELEALQGGMRHSGLDELAKHFALSIHRELERNIERLAEEVRARNYLEALDRFARLASKQPPEAYLKRAEALRLDLAKYKRQDVELLLTSMKNDLVTSDVFRREFESYQALFAGDVESTFIAKCQDAFDRLTHEERLEAVQAAYARDRDALAALAELGRLAAEFPERVSAGKDLKDSIVQDLVDARTGAFAKAVEQRDIKSAEELLAGLDGWVGHTPLAPEKLAKNWSAQISKLKRAVSLEALDKLTYRDNAELEKLAVAIAAQPAGYLAPAEKQQALAKVAALRARFADEILTDWIKNDYSFQRAKISQEYAEFTVDSYNFVRRHLPRSKARYAGDKLLFYSGSAYVRLREYGPAKENLQRAIKEYPRSPYVNFAKALLQKIEN